MRKFIGTSLLASITLALPALAGAADLTYILSLANTVLNAVIGLFVTLAIVVFFWGLIKYLVNAGEEKAAGLSIMFYGVVAIFVMVSIWGIIKLLQNTFKVGDNNPIVPRGIPLQTQY